MTICYPQIITARICPRSELNFSLTPPDCVRVVPVYNDASYVISQFPPTIHFLVRDNGQVYQLADIQSPPSTPPEYHAILDATGCILIGVELSAVTTVPLTNAQVSVLPGVIRHVLQTLGLSLNNVTNTLPPQRCRPQLWQQILAATRQCLNTPPPQPPPPPGLTCSFVLSCISPGQNVNISTNGIISAGQLVPGPNNDEYTWLSPNGTPLFTFNTSSTNPLAVQDTPTIDLTLTAGNVLSANVNISGQTNNQLRVLPDGLYISPASDPCLSNPPALANFPTDDLFVIYNGDTGCLEQINIPSERVVYGEPGGTGSPRADTLLYSPVNNFLRATVGPDFPMQNSFMLYGPGVNANGNFYSVIGSIANSNISDTVVSFVNVFNANGVIATDSVVVGQNSLSFITSEESALLFRNALISASVNSFITATNALVSAAAFSFVAAGFGTNHLSPILGSLSISLSSGDQPTLEFSSYLARSAFRNTGSPAISFSNANLDSVVFDNSGIYYSTAHLSFVRLLDDGFRNEFSFIAANNINLNSIRYSFFASDVNFNQAPSTRYSFVSMERQGSNRIGPSTPFIEGSVVITVDTLPNAYNALFINRDPNRFLSLGNSVYVANGVNVFENNPPNNTGSLRNSVIVGMDLDISYSSSYNSLTLIGENLSAGIQTVFGVGYDSYAPPQIQNVGGWLAYIADGGADNANYFQGWASAWRFRMFNPSINYVNDAAAIAALNVAYGADPRNNDGTMVVARVAGRPAIFTWDGTTFVRITV